jgi:hypothetical protein
MKTPCSQHESWYAQTLKAQQRTWVGLTDAQIEIAENQIWNTDQLDEVERQANKEFVRAIEAAHGIAPEGSDK